MASDVTMTVGSTDPEKSRKTWFSALASVFAVLAGVLLFGWVGLIIGWVDTSDLGIHRIHNAAGSGVGTGLFVATFAVTVASAIFWVAFALTMARNQRLGPPSDPHVQMHHWTGMAGMALALVLLGLLASFRTRGWRIVVWLGAAGSAVYGLASIVFATFPGTTVPYPGGEGVGWGLLAIVGGIALVVAAELDRRRTPITS
jgi:hypothetical protein